MFQSLAQISQPRGKRPTSARATLVVAVLATVLVDIQPAAAQFSFWDFGYQKHFGGRNAYRYREPAPIYQPRRQARRDSERMRAAQHQRVAAARNDQLPEQRPINATPIATIPSRPLFAIISISEQRLTVYGADGAMLHSKVSTGTADNPTPTGAFAIIQKNRWHESNLYSDSPMPFMQRITWSGVAMHHGKLPGYPASHGCIRLPWDFAEKWFGMTKLGLRIIVAPNDATPSPITHVNLPQPRYWPAPNAVANRPSPGLGKTAQLMTVRNDQTITAPSQPAEPAQMLDPQAYAAAERIRVRAALKQSQLAEGETEAAARRASQAAESAQDVARKASRHLSETLAPIMNFVTTGQSARGVPGADFETDLNAALVKYTNALNEIIVARIAQTETRTAAFEAASLATRTDRQTEALQARLAEMTRRQEPVSIFISRKDQRLYVRQALRPVADMPVTIENSDHPLGTHVFIATPKRADEHGLQWQAVSLPPEADQAKTTGNRRGGEIETASIAPVTNRNQADPGTLALNRIKLPGEVLDEISELLGPGSSMIVSDRGITHETGPGTDFIVQTKH